MNARAALVSESILLCSESGEAGCVACSESGEVGCVACSESGEAGCVACSVGVQRICKRQMQMELGL